MVFMNKARQRRVCLPTRKEQRRTPFVESHRNLCQPRIAPHSPDRGDARSGSDPYLAGAAPAQIVVRLFPHLATHRCDNGQGYTFRRECRETEIPHLFEHLIIELQAQAQPVEVLRGETQWNWGIDPRGRFYVFVDYENELLALGAIRLAERILACLDRRALEAIDPEAELSRLRELARLGRELTASRCRRRVARNNGDGAAGEDGRSHGRLIGQKNEPCTALSKQRRPVFVYARSRI
jgi:hypothetical protein